MRTRIENQWARNPSSWLSIAIFFGLIVTLFRYAPRTASATFGGLALWILIVHFRDRRRFRRLGYRVFLMGRDSFVYEELSESGPRALPIGGELMARGPRHVYIPSADAWAYNMPSWAQGRRDEILARIRGELGNRRVRYIETDT